MVGKARAEYALPQTQVADRAHSFAGQAEPAFVFTHSLRTARQSMIHDPGLVTSVILTAVRAPPPPARVPIHG